MRQKLTIDSFFFLPPQFADKMVCNRVGLKKEKKKEEETTELCIIRSHICMHAHTELQTAVVLDSSCAFEEAGAFSFTYMQGMSH